MLNAVLPPLGADSAFWWRITGFPLSLLLLHAGYNLQAQYQMLLFYYILLVPSLGESPTGDGRPGNWKSFMTDDFTPVEYSWSWDGANGPPTIRFSLEAIGRDSGTVTDPFNQAMTMDLVRQLQKALPSGDWQWFNHFSNGLLSRPSRVNCRQSSIFLAFELGPSEIVAKAYFLPVDESQPRISIITNAVKSLRRGKGEFCAFSKLESFLEDDPVGAQLKLEMLAVDCVAESRLKIYVRSPCTSFDSVSAILTMNGKLYGPEIASGLKELRELWHLVLGLDEDFPSSQELHQKDHRTSGVLYYFNTKPTDVVPGMRDPDVTPDPKVYIPVRHYAQNDRQVAQGLATFLERRGRDDYVQNYMNVLDGICTHRSLDSSCGMHTYISCGFKKGSLVITSYLSPEVYHQARWMT